MNKKHHYPDTKRLEVTDNFHGKIVADPYRWLEDPEAEETKAWITAQQQLTQAFLSELPYGDAFRERLASLWDFPRATVPVKRGDRYFFTRNEGLQNQNVLVQRKGLEGGEEMVIDPNALSEDGTVALVNQSTSADGRFLAYGLSYHGSDWEEVHIRDIEEEEEMGEVLRWIKFSLPAWLPDNSGFYYARYPAPEEMPDAPPNTHHRVYFHRLGTPQEADLLVYSRPDEPDFGYYPTVTEDGRYLVLTIWKGTDIRNRIYILDLSMEGALLPLFDDYDARYEFIDNDGSTFFFKTNLDAPNSRVIAVDLAQPKREHWREVIAEKEDVLDFALMVNDQFVTVYLHDAAHQLLLFKKDGSFDREINNPALGTIASLTGKREQQEFFFDFQSFLWPPAVFRYDFRSGQLASFHEPQIAFDRDGYVTHQEFLHAADGTRIPLFLTHKKDLVLDGSHPTVLYGYGGFGVNLTPEFDAHRLAWLERGGIYAQAVLRGGMEYGETWYAAGMLAKKQNVFDDFIAAAEWLIDEGYTSSAHLAIEGRSNGGLLVAACLIQRPELFGAVHSAVPVTDMLRFHRFTAGRYWTTDYGNAEKNAEDFETLIAYSPVHNTRPGSNYPPVLITTADTDDRVVPMHSFKLAAALQSTSNGENPILLRVDSKAGHGLGKPVGKLIEEWTDIYTFLWVFTS